MNLWKRYQLIGRPALLVVLVIISVVGAGWSCTTQTGSICFESMPTEGKIK